MRKNLAKHTAKKLPLAKRVLALCFALIFVCSCLLPAFANGTGDGSTHVAAAQKTDRFHHNSYPPLRQTISACLHCKHAGR